MDAIPIVVSREASKIGQTYVAIQA